LASNGMNDAQTVVAQTRLFGRKSFGNPLDWFDSIEFVDVFADRLLIMITYAIR